MNILTDKLKEFHLRAVYNCMSIILMFILCLLPKQFITFLSLNGALKVIGLRHVFDGRLEVSFSKTFFFNAKKDIFLPSLAVLKFTVAVVDYFHI